ncbi:MAG: hypothetical protein HUU20_28970, partial [Pirellulales bacterium]|nr:hypothetical protein [Pirellulales bacterium]
MSGIGSRTNRGRLRRARKFARRTTTADRVRRLRLEALEERRVLSPTIIPVPMNPSDLSVPHPTYNGSPTIFKAIARGVSPLAQYDWIWDENADGNLDNDPVTRYTADPDGRIPSSSRTVTLPTVGQDMLLNVGMKLRDVQTGEEIFSSYPVFVYASPPSGDPRNWTEAQLQVMRSVAVDDALWYLHTSLVTSGADNASISGFIPGPNNNQHDPTPSALLAFTNSGRFPAYPPRTVDGFGQPLPDGWADANDHRWNSDPYAEDALRMFNYVVSRMNLTNVDALAEANDGRTPIPGTDDGMGLFSPNTQIGEAGQVGYTGAALAAFASVAPTLGGAPVQVNGPVQGKTVEFVVQQMVDYAVYRQSDAGGWLSAPGVGQDGSTSQWAFIGLEAADRAMASQGVIVNQRAKGRLANLLVDSQTADGSARLYGTDTGGSFTPTAAMLDAASWLGVHDFDAANAAVAFPGDSPYTKGQLRQAYDRYVDYLRNHWTVPGQRDSRGWADGLWESGDYLQGSTNGLYNQGRGGNTYAIYSTQKGLRTIDPEPNLGSHDWQREFSTFYIRAQYRPPQGPAGMVLDNSAATTPILHNDLGGLWNTSLAVQVLAAAGNEPPAAHAGGPYVSGQGETVTLDATTSTDPNAPCDSIVAYEWDLDNDGAFDDAGGAKPAVLWATIDALGLSYPADPETGLPSNTIRLRVTDGFGLTNVATTSLTIYDNRPFAHVVANPTTVGVTAPITFTGSGSTHGNPNRTIVKYEWDFDYIASNFTVDAIGVNATHSYPLSGTYTAAHRVTDNNVPPKIDLTTVTIRVNSPPEAHAGGPYTGPEGSLLPLDGSASSDAEDPLTALAFEWDLDYDGLTFHVDATGMQPTVSFPDDFAVREIALRVTDSGGEHSIATTTLTVTNADPIVVLGPLVPGDLRPSTGDADGSVIAAPQYEFIKEGLE